MPSIYISSFIILNFGCYNQLLQLLKSLHLASKVDIFHLKILSTEKSIWESLLTTKKSFLIPAISTVFQINIIQLEFPESNQPPLRLQLFCCTLLSKLKLKLRTCSVEVQCSSKWTMWVVTPGDGRHLPDYQY